MKITITKYNRDKNVEYITTEEDGLITESKTIEKDDNGRILCTSTNNRKVEFIYKYTKDNNDLLYDLPVEVKITEKCDDGKIRTATAEGSIVQEGNLIYHKLPQFFGLTDDKPCEIHTYLSIYLINESKIHKGIISDKIYMNDSEIPSIEKYYTYYDDNFEMRSIETIINNSTFVSYLKTFDYDTLGRVMVEKDLILNTSLQYKYEDNKKISYLYDNDMGGIEAGISALILKVETLYDDNGNIIKQTSTDYTK